MRMRRKPSLVAGGLLAGASLALAGCGTGGGAAANTTTAGTLPPLPPTLMAFVTLAGTGGNIGFGHELVPVNISAGSEQVGAKIRVGTYPDSVVVNPAGTMAYVANYSSNTVTPIDLHSDTPEKAIPAGPGPADIAITPDGKTAYVTDDGSAASLGHTVTPIDLTTGKAEAAIGVGAGPQGVVITPDGKTAYVTNAGAIVTGQTGAVGSTVTPIDLATRKARHAIKVGNGPTGIAVTRDGSTVFVTNLDSGSVSPISTASDTAGAPIGVPGGPVAVAVSRNTAWVLDTPSNGSTGDNVVPISASTHTAGSPILVGKGAQDIAITPDGKTAWVSCLGANLIESIDLVRKKAGASVHIAGGPFGIAVANQSANGSSSGAGQSSSPPSTSHKKHKKSSAAS
ncbi:MAG: YncE family protein [Acidimicrobiales bacterium]